MKFIITLLAPAISAVVLAQEPVGLGAAQRLAAEADPRVVELRLEAAQTELRLRTIEMERRPALSIEGQAQHQSQTVEIPFTLPGGGAPPRSPKDTFDGHLAFEQPLADPSRRARMASERASSAEANARIQSALYGLRREVNEAFFGAALLQEREAEVSVSIAGLQARLHEAEERVAAGAALPGEAAAFEAAMLQRSEDLAELRAARRAALARLTALTGRSFTMDDRLVVPALGLQFMNARPNAGSLRERPEFAQFARTLERLDAQQELVGAARRPQLSAYGRAGIGRPGLNFLSDRVNPYWLAGVRFRWSPLDWGKVEREQKVLELQKQSVRAETEAFARTLERAVQNDLTAADRLTAAAGTDERIVALRELIEREARAQYDEHVITAADYTIREGDVLAARLMRATHRVELAEAQARALNVLGVEVP